MKRTQIYLTEKEHEELDKMAEQTGKTKSWLIREAVEEYVITKKPAFDKKEFMKAVEGVYGMWKDRDPEEFRQIRKEFNRIDTLWNKN
jgi:metal-responsive CopG/Arc/MetJ family transcriptional regulator